MKVLVAPNAFKGSLSALSAADAIERGLKSARADLEIEKLPIADGGDGTAEILALSQGGTLETVSVQDALGRPVQASFGVLPDGTGAVDVAAASGLRWIEPERRDPRITSSYGTGQLMAAALDRGVSRIVLGVGGSATVDGGAGLLTALGARFSSSAGRELSPGGAALRDLEGIDLDALDPRLRSVELVVACDVENPLLGDNGAARVFAPQKGADERAVRELEQALARLSDVLSSGFGVNVATLPRAGSAGGIAAGLHALLGARLVSGIDFVLETLEFDRRLRGVDLVITGEGRLDRQTLSNKGPFGVALAARRRAVSVIALAGSIDQDLTEQELSIFDAAFSIRPRGMTLEASMRDAGALLAAAAARTIRENAGVFRSNR